MHAGRFASSGHCCWNGRVEKRPLPSAKLCRIRRVPEWEEYPHTPGVFVRVANAGLTGYGTWKSVRKMGDGSETGGRVVEGRGERRAFVLKEMPPVFFVTAHSKGIAGENRGTAHSKRLKAAAFSMSWE
jgi:hypothetical protein